MSDEVIYRVPLAAHVRAGSSEEAYNRVSSIVGARNAALPDSTMELLVGPPDEVAEWVRIRPNDDPRLHARRAARQEAREAPAADEAAGEEANRPDAAADAAADEAVAP